MSDCPAYTTTTTAPTTTTTMPSCGSNEHSHAGNGTGCHDHDYRPPTCATSYQVINGNGHRTLYTVELSDQLRPTSTTLATVYPSSCGDEPFTGIRSSSSGGCHGHIPPTSCNTSYSAVNGYDHVTRATPACAGTVTVCSNPPEGYHGHSYPNTVTWSLNEQRRDQWRGWEVRSPFVNHGCQPNVAPVCAEGGATYAYVEHLAHLSFTGTSHSFHNPDRFNRVRAFRMNGHVATEIPACPPGEWIDTCPSPGADEHGHLYWEPDGDPWPADALPYGTHGCGTGAPGAATEHQPPACAPEWVRDVTVFAEYSWDPDTEQPPAEMMTRLRNGEIFFHRTDGPGHRHTSNYDHALHDGDCHEHPLTRCGTSLLSIDPDPTNDHIYHDCPTVNVSGGTNVAEGDPGDTLVYAEFTFTVTKRRGVAASGRVLRRLPNRRLRSGSRSRNQNSDDPRRDGSRRSRGARADCSRQPPANPTGQ